MNLLAGTRRLKRIGSRMFRLLPLLRRAEARFKEIWMEGPGGRKIYTHLHLPAQGNVPLPGIVIVPGGVSAGSDYDRAELTASDIAAAGFAVLHYDPSGRGRTGGEEDHWGPLHQEELSVVVDRFSSFPEVMRENIGLMSFSIGITIAAGALAKYPMPVGYLFDWEGPSNRFNITMNDTFEHLRDFPSSMNAFWKEREAAAFIGGVRCGYFRYQAENDHVQGAYKGHAIELLNLATNGRAAWTRCNDNPVNTVFDAARIGEYHWIPDDAETGGQMLKHLLELRRYVQDRK